MVRKYGKVFQLLLQIKACGAQADDYEKTILMFRKKVSDLNEEIQERYDEVSKLAIGFMWFISPLAFAIHNYFYISVYKNAW